MSRQWSATNAIKDDRRRMKEIDRLLDEIPTANKRNIEFLFKFLAQLTVEEVTKSTLHWFVLKGKRNWSQSYRHPKVTNKMSISNLTVVLGPNLLWEAGTLKQVNLEHVCRFRFLDFLYLREINNEHIVLYLHLASKCHFQCSSYNVKMKQRHTQVFDWGVEFSPLFEGQVLHLFFSSSSSLMSLKRSESEQDIFRRGESVVEHWEGEVGGSFLKDHQRI